MKIFLDTANIQSIKTISGFTNIHGVTTNPSLIAKENIDYVSRIVEIVDIFKYYKYFESISVELISTEYNDMVSELDNILNKINNMMDKHDVNIIKNCITIKLPLTVNGLKMCTYIKKSIPYLKVNMTLIFSLQQAILAVNNDADYISPFIGRIDDIGYDGMLLIKNIVEYLSNYSYLTEVIGASIRTIDHVNTCAIYGCDIVTVPQHLIIQMVKHPLTNIGLEKFIEDYNKMVERNQ